VGRLEAGGKLGNSRRLTLDERYNIPFAWTPDSKAIIFNSDRTGRLCIYKQGLDQSVPELIPTGPENIQMVRVSPDGAWLIYSALFPNESDTVRLMRVPLAGGAPEVVLETKANNFDCPHRAAPNAFRAKEIPRARWCCPALIQPRVYTANFSKSCVPSRGKKLLTGQFLPTARGSR